MITGNRQLNDLKIKRIIKDINDGIDVLRYCPILVQQNADGKRLDIIDGQHRFWVSKKLKTHVWYILVEEMELMEIAKINSNTEKWKDKDFINCYVQQKNKNYQVLQEFIDKYGFPIGVSVMLLSRGYLTGDGGTSNKKKHDFKSGLFKVTHYEDAVVLADIVLKFKSFSGMRTGSFVEAIGRIKRAGKIKMEDLLKKHLEDPFVLKPQKNTKAYLTELELLYNKGKASRKIIY